MNSNEPNDSNETPDERSRADELREAKRLTDQVRRPAGDWNGTDEIRRWRETRRPG